MPVFVSGFIGDIAGPTVGLGVLIVLLVYGILVFPMANLAVALHDSVWTALNPAFLLISISRVFSQYTLTCILLLLVIAVSVFFFCS
ncbi:MAG TPA: hypothetical protein EYQ50_18400 [Verrucomicrobiales bacterium]|nr:hypothetical protein [Verrucomicrobiales bacterium]